MASIIPQDPKQQRSLVIALVFLAALYFTNSWWLGPKRETLTAESSRLEALERSNQDAEELATSGSEDLEERMAVYERHIAQLEQLIPDREQVAALINSVVDETRSAGVELDFIDPVATEPIGAYTRETFELRIIGDYHNFGRFLSRIASLPRIITPVDMDMRPFTEQGGSRNQYVAPILATFRIQTYVIPDEGESFVGGPAGGDR